MLVTYTQDGVKLTSENEEELILLLSIERNGWRYSINLLSEELKEILKSEDTRNSTF